MTQSTHARTHARTRKSRAKVRDDRLWVALAALVAVACSQGESAREQPARTAQGLDPASAEVDPSKVPATASDLHGDSQPLFRKERLHRDTSPDCEDEAACTLRLPLGLPEACGLWPRPYTGAVSSRVLFSGCGLVGARFTARTDRTDGVSGELWYSLTTGALVGRGVQDTAGTVRTWGEGPPADCELLTCDPCTLEQKDPGTPTVNGLFRPKAWCDLPDVGVDPATRGQWVREPVPVERLEDPPESLPDRDGATAPTADGGAP